MAYYLDIDVSTLYNWRKHKPNLYHIVMLGFKFNRAKQEKLRILLDSDNNIKDEIERFR